jgi:hypothetical protein
MSVEHNTSAGASSSLQLRTALLEAVLRYNEEHLTSSSPSASTSGLQARKTTEDSGGDARSLLQLFVQRNDCVTNPSWAMEECGRLCPKAELWSGSMLPKDVWAPPGSPDCPFGTVPADFRLHQ